MPICRCLGKWLKATPPPPCFVYFLLVFSDVERKDLSPLCLSPSSPNLSSFSECCFLQTTLGWVGEINSHVLSSITYCKLFSLYKFFKLPAPQTCPECRGPMPCTTSLVSKHFWNAGTLSSQSNTPGKWWTIWCNANKLCGVRKHWFTSA